MLSPCSHQMTGSKGGVSGVVRLQGRGKEGKISRRYCDDRIPIPTDSAELYGRVPMGRCCNADQLEEWCSSRHKPTNLVANEAESSAESRDRRDRDKDTRLGRGPTKGPLY